MALFWLPLAALAAKKLADRVLGSSASGRARGGSYTLVDRGNHGNYYWFAVPRHQAAAFKAEHPGAGAAETFLTVVRNRLRRQPEAEPYVAPITEQVIAALREYPNCQIFVLINS